MKVDRVVIGDCRETLRTFEADSVQCVVCSPPYWGLRDYGHRDQLGLEASPALYVESMVSVFREVRRVLRPDGVLWLNLGDSYITNPHGHGPSFDPKWPGGRDRAVDRANRGSSRPGINGRGEPQIEGYKNPEKPKRLENESTRHALYRMRAGAPSSKSTLHGNGHDGGGPKLKGLGNVPLRAGPPRPLRGGAATSGLTNPERQERVIQHERPNDSRPDGLKHKDLVMIPARVALALQADGWWLRSVCIWEKPNPMPESVVDRPTTAHEYVFLLSKSERYFYDAKAIAEPAASMKPAGNKERQRRSDAGGLHDTKTAAAAAGTPMHHSAGFGVPWADIGGTRNARSVWRIPTTPYRGAHFAVMPAELARRCVLAGSRVGDLVLDPFMGSGTVAQVAEELGRHWLGCELNPEYSSLIAERTRQIGLLTRAAR